MWCPKLLESRIKQIQKPKEPKIRLSDWHDESTAFAKVKDQIDFSRQQFELLCLWQQILANKSGIVQQVKIIGIYC